MEKKGCIDCNRRTYHGRLVEDGHVYAICVMCDRKTKIS